MTAWEAVALPLGDARAMERFCPRRLFSVPSAAGLGKLAGAMARFWCQSRRAVGDWTRGSRRVTSPGPGFSFITSVICITTSPARAGDPRCAAHRETHGRVGANKRFTCGVRSVSARSRVCVGCPSYAAPNESAKKRGVPWKLSACHHIAREQQTDCPCPKAGAEATLSCPALG